MLVQPEPNISILAMGLCKGDPEALNRNITNPFLIVDYSSCILIRDPSPHKLTKNLSNIIALQYHLYKVIL